MKECSAIQRTIEAIMNCPSCGLIYPPTAQVCDCGFNFETQSRGKPMGNNTAAVFVRDQIITRTGREFTLASLGSRLKGQLLDGAIALALTFCLMFPFLFMGLSDEIIASLALIIYFGYLLFADAFKGGQSLGKRVMKTAVINLNDGKPCSFIQSLVRNIIQVFGIIDWVFIFGKKHQRLGDMAAGTIVVRA
jgi:uncharacterized RDD family membrane protein YckC